MLHAKPNASDPSSLRSALVDLRPALLRRALQLARSRPVAEDLVQDTLERAMRFEGSYQRGSNLRAWAHQVLFSIFVTRCRRARREHSALSTLRVDPCAWTTREPSALPVELSPPVRRALESLPTGYRDAILLIDVHELPYKEAAARLGVPIGTIMSRLFRGRRLLAAIIRDLHDHGVGVGRDMRLRAQSATWTPT